jgi:co-chaperonin GroES (HSP10)
MTLEIRPLNGKVLILPEPTAPADTFLHIPESSMNRDMPCFGTVFATGGRQITKKGVVLDHEIFVGDRVFFPRFTGLWVDVRGKKLIQVAEKDVAAIIGPSDVQTSTDDTPVSRLNLPPWMIAKLIDRNIGSIAKLESEISRLQYSYLWGPKRVAMVQKALEEYQRT